MLKDGPDTSGPSREAVAALMPELLADLVRLLGIQIVEARHRCVIRLGCRERPGFVESDTS